MDVRLNANLTWNEVPVYRSPKGAQCGQTSVVAIWGGNVTNEVCQSFNLTVTIHFLSSW